jgi:hypothetical protein
VIGYWRFDEAPGSTSAPDLSGNGNPCQLRGLDPARDWTAGRAGSAISLEGRGWLMCTQPRLLARLAGDLTISLWVKRSSGARGLQALVARQLGDERLDHFFFGIDGQRKAVVFSSHLLKGALRYKLPEAALAQWTHLAVVHSADGWSRLFVGGTAVMRKQTTRALLGGGANPLIIGGAINGRGDGAGEELFDGAIDELVIYDRAVSPAEIAALAGGAQPTARQSH